MAFLGYWEVWKTRIPYALSWVSSVAFDLFFFPSRWMDDFSTGAGDVAMPMPPVLIDSGLLFLVFS